MESAKNWEVRRFMNARKTFYFNFFQNWSTDVFMTNLHVLVSFQILSNKKCVVLDCDRSYLVVMFYSDYIDAAEVLD